MPSTQNAVNNHEYRSVPITALAESATNPRKRFDPKSLEELAASFKTQGILALFLRELEESKYEVVAGARRLRAAKLAELETASRSDSPVPGPSGASKANARSDWPEGLSCCGYSVRIQSLDRSVTLEDLETA